MPRYSEGTRVIYNGIPGVVEFVEGCDCQDCLNDYGPDGLIEYEVRLDEYDEYERDYYTLGDDEIVLFDPPKRQKGFAKFIQAKNL